jgi:predicted ATPase
MTVFLGREAELAEGARLLADTRLLTVTGPGGAGKTRYALELARGAEPRYADGLVASFLASLRDAELVLPTIARSLGIPEQPGRSALESIVAHARHRHALVVLDNLEHLPDSRVELADVVENCPGLTFLCTSRARLRLRAELVYQLPPLNPDEAVALFCERARVAPSPTIRELCARLDGLPLAIELAAARLGLLTPEQLLARLGRRLDLLTGTRDADPRQQTLRATVQWSYDLLSAEEQRLLARLSVFAGGCTREAAVDVCEADVEALESLLDKSLVRRLDTGLGPRFWMLEAIRELASEKLEAAGEREDLLHRYTSYFLSLARRHAPAHYGQESSEDQAVYRTERANYRQAFARALAVGDGDAAHRFVRFLGDYWHANRELAEGFDLARRALLLAARDPNDRAHALHRAGRLAFELGDEELARGWFSAAERALAEHRDDHGLWQVLQERAFYEAVNGNYDDAVSFAERALRLAGPLRQDELDAISTSVLVHALTERELARLAPDRAVLRRACEIHVQVLEWARSAASPAFRLYLEANHGWLCLQSGEAETALRHLDEALSLGEAEDCPWEVLEETALVVGVAGSHAGRFRTSALVLEAVLADLEREHRPVHRSEAPVVARARAMCRRALGASAYEQIVREAVALDAASVLQLARSVSASPRRPATP